MGNSLKTVVKLCKNKSINFRDFLISLDKDEDGYLSHIEFRMGLKRKLALELSDEEFQGIISHIDKDGTGEIEIAALVKFTAQHKKNRKRNFGRSGRGRGRGRGRGIIGIGNVNPKQLGQEDPPPSRDRSAPATPLTGVGGRRFVAPP